MLNREKIVKGIEICANRVPGKYDCNECPYEIDGNYCEINLTNDIIILLKEQEKEIKALHLLVEWAEECDFGFDQFPDEYERYKDEIKGMKYIDGMIHIAKRTLEDRGAFAEGR